MLLQSCGVQVTFMKPSTSAPKSPPMRTLKNWPGATGTVTDAALPQLLRHGSLAQSSSNVGVSFGFTQLLSDVNRQELFVPGHSAVGVWLGTVQETGSPVTGSAKKQVMQSTLVSHGRPGCNPQKWQSAFVVQTLPLTLHRNWHDEDVSHSRPLNSQVWDRRVCSAGFTSALSLQPTRSPVSTSQVSIKLFTR